MIWNKEGPHSFSCWGAWSEAVKKWMKAHDSELRWRSIFFDERWRHLTWDRHQFALVGDKEGFIFYGGSFKFSSETRHAVLVLILVNLPCTSSLQARRPYHLWHQRAGGWTVGKKFLDAIRNKAQRHLWQSRSCFLIRCDTGVDKTEADFLSTQYCSSVSSLKWHRKQLVPITCNSGEKEAPSFSWQVGRAANLQKNREKSSRKREKESWKEKGSVDGNEKEVSWWQ